MRLTFASAILLLLLLCGCDLLPGLGGGPGETPDEPFQLDSPHQRCGELKGTEVLQRVRSGYATDLTGEINSRLTIEISYTGGAMTCYPPGWVPPGSLAPLGPERVEVMMNVRMATADRQFDESFKTTFEIIPGKELTTFTYGIDDLTELQGAYYNDMPEYEHVAITFSGSFNREFTEGAVFRYGWTQEEKVYRGTALVPIARWINRKN